MKRPDGVTLLALWHFALAGSALLSFLALCGLGGLLGLVAAAEGDLSIGALEIGVFSVLALVLLLSSAVLAAVGAGLWNVRPWARLPALLIAVLGLLEFPVGTIVGGLTLWYLLRNEGGGLALRRERPWTPWDEGPAPAGP